MTGRAPVRRNICCFKEKTARRPDGGSAISYAGRTAGHLRRPDKFCHRNIHKWEQVSASIDDSAADENAGRSVHQVETGGHYVRKTFGSKSRGQKGL